jgi:pimeloyl-ACP methyl ester carboxylesterase
MLVELSGTISDGIFGTFPVSIQRYDGGPIDPTKPSWLIIHGWNSDPAHFSDLANAIHGQRASDQILTLDWSEAAQGPDPSIIEQRIPLVANWASMALVNYGFSGSNLDLIGHSFGSYVAGELAEQVAGGVNTIVALDPALDVPGGYNPDGPGGVNFAQHSKFSWAFHDSDPFSLADSDSGLGSPTTPVTAHEAFDVVNSSHTEIPALFTYMVNHPNDPVGQYFTLQRLLDHAAGPWIPNEFDANGVASTSGGYETVITANSSGLAPQSIQYFPASVPAPGQAVATGDFNGDGVKDILWQNAVGATSEWLMAPNGGVASAPLTPEAAGWNLVASGDFNHDGTTDLMWQNATSGVTSEWLMSNGAMASNPATPSAAGWNLVASGDYNGDGTDDLMWQNATSGVTSEWLMSNGAMASNPATPSAAGWNLVASADFNGDGTKDLMWQNATSGATSEWLMSNGAMASNPATPSAAGWNLVASGDFNGDGTKDLMWQNATSGVTSEWLMSNGAMASNPATPSAAGWNLVASGDFNGNGTDDLMWQNATSGATSEWLMSNGAMASNPATPSAAGWQLAAGADFNGDGIIDLMWQNALSGGASEWLMSAGGGVSSFPSMPMTIA